MHLSQIKILFILILSSFLLSCGNDEVKPKKKDYVVKIGNSFLTKESVSNYAGSKKYSGKYVDEVINDWIEKELLFSVAKEEGITKEGDYKSLIEQSKKELASALYLEKYFENNLKPVTESEVQGYFGLNQEQFRLKDNAYFLNVVRFDNMNDAEEFREEVINSSWIRAVTKFSNKNKILNYDKDFFIYEHQLSPLKLLRSIEALKDEEFSLSVKTNEGDYIVAQLISRLLAGEIPDFELVKNDVENRYYAQKKKELYKKLISELSEKYEIVINKEKVR